jgi:hypothetical protein
MTSKQTTEKNKKSFIILLSSVIVSLPFWLFGIFLCYYETQLYLDGQTSKATIVDSFDQETRRVERKGYVKYTFKTKDKQEISGYSLLENENWKNLFYGKDTDKAEVFYSLSKPEINRLSGENYYIYGGISCVSGLIISLIGFLIAFMYKKSNMCYKQQSNDS